MNEEIIKHEAQVVQEDVEVTEEVSEAPQYDLMSTPLSQLPEDVRNQAMSSLENHIYSTYNRGDSVNVIFVHPEDEEVFTQAFSAMVNIPDSIKETIPVIPNDKVTGIPSVLLQSNVERQWLANYFNELGLLDWISKDDSPVVPTLQDLKMLYLMHGVQECIQKQKKIVIPT